MNRNHLGGNRANLELRAKAVELSKTGIGIKAIAKKLGCSTQLVRKARMAVGMPTWIGPKGGWQPEQRALAAIKAHLEMEVDAIRKTERMWRMHPEYLAWKNQPPYWRNVERSRDYRRVKALKRYHDNKHDGVFRFVRAARYRVWKACKWAGASKSGKTEILIGCSVDSLRHHIESNFKRGMNWNNYGEWHVDHIIPCSSFDLSKPEQQRQCFHYTNLRPLWAKENMSKHDTMPANPQLSLLM